eukprot:4132549-Alexandrium_andersonii.AAC.1
MLVDPGQLDDVIAAVTQLWASMGLTINAGKLAVRCTDTVANSTLPPHWQAYRVQSLPVLGRKLHLHLGGEGLPYELGGQWAMQNAVGKLSALHGRLVLLTQQ